MKLFDYRRMWLAVAVVMVAAVVQPAWAVDSLADSIGAMLASEDLDHGIQGVVIRSLKTGRTLYELNSDLALIPASNMKLLVSATALDRLGPDFTYQTSVLRDGSLAANGQLAGSLILRGAGDPTMRTEDLAALARGVHEAGIREVTGELVVDESLFDHQRLGWGWSWDYEPYYYAAQISALNLNRNTVDVYVGPGAQAGAEAVVRLDPPAPHVTVRSAATTGESGSTKSVWVSRERGRNVITVGGSIPVDAKADSPEEPISLEDPAVYAGEIFRLELARVGIRVAGSVFTGKTPEAAVVLATHTSPPLSSIVALLNKPSDNLIAEVLLKTLGVVTDGKGSTSAGADVEIKFFERIGMDTSSLRIVDGSGLSRLNLISAGNLADLLTHMHGHRHSAVYLASLPIAGVDGTLRNRMKATAAESNVLAKTGYVGRVSSLSGYVKTRSGEPLVFSILMNNHLCANTAARAIQDNICALLAELP